MISNFKIILMKKIITILLSFLTLQGFAQTRDSLRDTLNIIFQYIDKSQIPTGYLVEYGLQIGCGVFLRRSIETPAILLFISSHIGSFTIQYLEIGF